MEISSIAVGHSVTVMNVLVQEICYKIGRKLVKPLLEFATGLQLFDFK